MSRARIHVGDAREVLREMPDESFHCCVTSPPYWGLRDYGVDGQLGLEETPEAYVEAMVEVFREVRRVLREDGTLWLVLGDSYAGSWGAQGRTGSMADRSVVSARQIEAHPKKASGTGSTKDLDLKPKDLVGIPWRVAFALQRDGWWLRSDIIWAKPNPMPESVTDRPTKAHEYVFLLSKSERYYYDADAIREDFADDRMGDPGSGRDADRLRETYNRQDPQAGLQDAMPHLSENGGRNRRTVWEIATKPYSEAHFATFPPGLVEPCILAGCPEGGTVLDPFAGSGTLGMVATGHGRDAVLIDLNPDYVEMMEKRVGPMFVEVPA